MRIIQFLYLLFLEIKALLPNTIDKRKGKRIMLQIQNNKCLMCKKEFNNMTPHEIHHIDHNRTNNTLNNFVVLCSNCHSAVHRYGVKLPN
tara:strand:- start:6032 stop:6301 length:270 start_codon:yes stop_codon:yes gene_type:complete